jgi:hypothetical protein
VAVLLYLQARYRIQQVSLCLLGAWRPEPVNGNRSSSNGNHSSSSKSRSSSKQYAGTAGALQLQVPQPGAFPQTLLAAKDKESGQPLSADLVSNRACSLHAVLGGWLHASHLGPQHIH